MKPDIFKLIDRRSKKLNKKHSLQEETKSSPDSSANNRQGDRNNDKVQSSATGSIRNTETSPGNKRLYPIE